MKFLVKVSSQLFYTCIITSIIAILAFVILKDGIDDSEPQIIENLKLLVKQGIGSFAVPHQYLVSIINYLHLIIVALTGSSRFA